MTIDPASPRHAPPQIHEVLELDRPVLDQAYDVYGLLDGVKGIWHRLWSAMILRHLMRAGDQSVPDDLLHEFEVKFGTPNEIQ